VTYYQFTTKRASKTSGFNSAPCALKKEPLEHGELFITYTTGSIEAFKALRCPVCGAVFAEHFWSENDSVIENAHFLSDTTENN
jgi:hypothetical protein